MINFEEWVADISSSYNIDIYKKPTKAIGCVPLKEGLEYAKNLKIPFICYEMSSDEEKKLCKELNDIVGVKGFVGYTDHVEEL